MTIITAKEASEILGVSQSRISQLLQSRVIGIPEKGIYKEFVEDYANKRRNGRPEGSYKKGE